jgi:hypothetical protein
MTHELIANGEHGDGPEHDHNLPDAVDIPTFDDPADSDAAPLHEDD